MITIKELKEFNEKMKTSFEGLQKRLKVVAETCNNENLVFQKRYQIVVPELQSLMGMSVCLMSHVKMYYPYIMELYETAYYNQLKFYMNDAKADIFTTLRTKEDRDIFIRRAQNELSEMHTLVNSVVNIMESCEKMSDTCKEIQFSFASQKDYEKFLQGV